jgi:hypothetical protein
MQLSPPAGEARFIDIGWVIGFVDCSYPFNSGQGLGLI